MNTSNRQVWTEQGFRPDTWHVVKDVADLVPGRDTLLSYDAFVALGSGRPFDGPSAIGVELLPGEPIERIVPHLDALRLVSLVFPAFGDGRSYSRAWLLRRRYGYQGPLRATGDVLIDQIPLMLRTGFTEFMVSHQPTLDRLAQGDAGGIAYRYQPSLDPGATGEAYSWRRRKA